MTEVPEVEIHSRLKCSAVVQKFCSVLDDKFLVRSLTRRIRVHMTTLNNPICSTRVLVAAEMRCKKENRPTELNDSRE